MAQVKKLSVATVFGGIQRDTLKRILDGERIKVMMVYGMAVGVKTGQSTYGDWTALVGQFKAIHPETGEVSEAATLFLPDVALIPIQVQLAANNNQAVSFAMEVYASAAVNPKPGGSPYEYSFEHVLPPAEDDPVRRLELRMAEAGVLKLAAPDDKGDKGDKDGKPAAKTGRAK